MTVAELVLINVNTERHMNLYRDVCKMEPTISLIFLNSAYLRQGSESVGVKD